nr:family 43 glycosylhydrolase [uncultured Carboxylicivirga sp.]
MKKLYLCLISLLLSISFYAQNFTNPIYDLADPHIVTYNGFYYATGTSGGNVVLKKSKTIEGLKSSPAVEVFSPAKGGPCCAYWAPELHRLDNKWYIYYTANDINNLSGQRTYVIENSNDDPTSQNWVNKGRIYDSYADYWAIDGTVLTLNDVNYFIWSGVANPSDGDKPQRIYIAEMLNPYTLKPGRTLLSSPDQSWESNGAVNEGPEVIKKSGKVFVVYSANGCWTPDYLLGMVSMDDTEDPLNAAAWTKHSSPVFVKKTSIQVYGPGHHCFFTSPDGTEDWFAYHATTEEGGACDYTRSVRAQQLYWNEDGTPDFREAIPTGLRMKAPSGEPTLPEKSTLANGVYKILARHSGKALDVAGCSQKPGANVHQWDDNGLDCQKWVVQATEGGYYTIVAVAGGLALDISNCSTENGANVGMWQPNAADCHLYSIYQNGDGYYYIVSKRSSKVLEIADGSTQSGANLQQNSSISADYQQFDFVLQGELINPTGGYVSWESYNMPGKFIRHQSSRARMDSYLPDADDSYWKMVPGLAGTGVSFQSKNFPIQYLRYQNGELWLAQDDNSVDFEAEATFNKQPGLANSKMVSFQSFQYTDKYIRHRNNLLYVETISSDLDKADATFQQLGTDDASTGLKDDKTERVSVYPNPTDGVIHFRGLSDQIKHYNVFNIYGKKVKDFDTITNMLDISELPSGLYFVEIISSKGRIIEKILKN